MFIKASFQGRLGNQMYIYATVRTLAEDKGMQFSCYGEQSLSKIFPDIYLGDNCQESGIEIIRETSYQIDPQILNISKTAEIRGFFQNPGYFDHNKEKIKSWFPISKIEIPSICAIHVRGTDFLNLSDYYIPSDYYNKAIKKVSDMCPGVKFVGVTDDPSFAKKILGSEIEVRSSIVLEDLIFMYSCPYAIISNSTLSWWARYLCSDNCITIAPLGYGEINKIPYKNFIHIEK